MKVHSQHRPTTPRRVSFRLALLAFMLLMAQPSHWITCCLAAFSGVHTAPSTSHRHAPPKSAQRGAIAWDVAHKAANVKADTHSDGFFATSHIVRDSHHHHLPCCADFCTASLTQKTARSGIGDAGFLIPFVAPAMPVFRLDVLEGRCTRAGPPDERPFSLRLASSLLGRAPPLSA